jgi:hypothetical protein
MFSSLSGGCVSVESVRKPDVEATIKVWRVRDGLVMYTTVDGKTYVTKMDVRGIYE